ncbi:hypothetical protein SLS62_004653 [Diatrype stigma]|uniref:Uncharacterized protein n=1 Tax=Diatrype stigma TaxID=117547 RepID=A0AAN9YP29_9PEZI
MTRLASRPLPIQVLGYEYDGELSVRGIRIASASDIRRVLSNRNLLTIYAVSEKVLYRQLHNAPTNAWLTAQLDLYGIRYPYFSDREGYISLLRTESSKPDFDASNVPILRMYPFKKTWEERWRIYKESLASGRHEEEFLALATLEEKANYDADMFIEFYFKSRETLPRPIALRGIRFDVVQEAARRIPGLIAWAVGEGSRKLLWLGWDKDAMEREWSQQKLINHDRPKRKRLNGAEACAAQKKLDQEDAFIHADIMQMGKNILMHHRERKKPFRMAGVPYIEGSYLLDIVDPEIAMMYHGQGPRWIDVGDTPTSGVYEATYDIQPMGKGVMLFCDHKDLLSAHAEMCDVFANAGLRGKTEAFRAFHLGFLLGWTRKRRIMEADTPESIAAKRARQYVTAKTPPGITRLYMHWRGTGGQLDEFWRKQGRHGRIDQGEDGWVEFNTKKGGQLTINFGIGTIDGELKAYKVEGQSHFTGGSWPNARRGGAYV